MILRYIIFTSLLMSSFYCFSAQTIQLKTYELKETYSELNILANRRESSLVEDIPQLLPFKIDSVGPDTEFKRIGEINHSGGLTHTRFQQYYKGLPVWGRQVVLHSDLSGNVRKINGSVTNNIDLLLPFEISEESRNNLAAKELIAQAIELERLTDKTLEVDDRNVEIGVYVDEHDNASVAYFVSFFYRSDEGIVGKPVYIIDAQTEKVLFKQDGLQRFQATGPGGNVKTGSYQYGSNGVEHLDVTESNGVCTMENNYVRTIDLNHSTSTYLDTPYTFTCPENTHKEINGAYSPLNDAHFFAGVALRMYRDWYNVAAIPSQVLVKVHYGSNYEDSFWNGNSIYIGDGHNRFHPLVSLDFISHEIAHGFTLNNSQLNPWGGQSSAIGESFADIAGEAAEFFHKGSNDWLVANDIHKGNGALRYFQDPTKDGFSIDNASNYSFNLDRHFASGVFNKAFYLLANTSGWDVRKAFNIFVDANRNYWISSSDFEAAACGVINAADDRGYEIIPVMYAFEQVGVSCSNIPSRDSDNDGIPDLWEYRYGLNYQNASDAALDLDNDGLSNLTEYQLQTLPSNVDSDGDGLNDGDEVTVHQTNPAIADSDSDGLSDGVELNTHQTDPNNTDSDADGMPDGWEVLNGLNPLLNDAANDNDGDGRSNLTEYQQGTNPRIVETVDVEPNNILAQAQLIDGYFNLTYSANIGDQNQNTSQTIPHLTIIGSGNESFDYYRFTVFGAPARAIFDIDGGYESNGTGSFANELRLYDTNGTELGFSDGASTDHGQGGSSSWRDAFLEYTFATDGEYVIKVSHQNDTVIPENATYKLQVSLQLNDTDGDYMPDQWELRYGFDPNNGADAQIDSDGDGLTNLREYRLGTSPTNADTDGDGLNDGEEVDSTGSSPLIVDTDGDGLSDHDEVRVYGSNPANADSDNDGLTDLNEVNVHGTSPINADTDSDGMPDKFELDNNIDPRSAADAAQDLDNDGLSNLREYQLGTLLRNSDSDNDGLTDGNEFLVHGTSPVKRDTDDDGMDDGWEVQYGLNPLVDDSQLDLDWDGWTNIQEYRGEGEPNNSVSIPYVTTAYATAVDGSLAKIDLLTGERTILQTGVSLFTYSSLGFSLEGRLYTVQVYYRGTTAVQEYRVNNFTTDSGDYSAGVSANGMAIDDQGTMYLVAHYGTGSALYRVEPNGGAPVQVGQNDIANIMSLAWDGHTLWAVQAVGSNDNVLYKLNKATGEATVVANLNGDSLGRAVGLSVDNRGVLWGIDTEGNLFTINKATAQVSIKHQIAKANGLSFSALSIEPYQVDRDGDGMLNSWERFYGLNELDPNDAAVDTDNDGLTNLQEFIAKTNPNSPDTDGDTVVDGQDAYPTDSAHWEAADLDSDGDGMLNSWEREHGLNENDSSDAATDLDNDGLTNLQEFNLQTDPRNSDTDGDNVADGQDRFPKNIFEWLDTDSDGIGNNADTDDDNDGVNDSQDALPLDPSEYLDHDGDGIGNNADTDDDGDGVPDHQDAFPFNGAESVDTDGDGIGNNADPDDDNDGILDDQDPFPLTSNEFSDIDSDGMSDKYELDNNLDPRSAADALVDLDNDGLNNLEEFRAGSLPRDPDSDDDGLSDGEEVLDHGTSAVNKDTDGDAMNDGWEVRYGLDPLVGDSQFDQDWDGWSNVLEYNGGTDPTDPQSIPEIFEAYTTGSVTLRSINLSTAEDTLVGFPYYFGGYSSMAFAPDGSLYGIIKGDWRVGDKWMMYRFNVHADESEPATFLSEQHGYQGMTFDSDGVLYMVAGAEDGALYTVDVNTGDVTLVGRYEPDHIDSIAWDGEQLWGVRVKDVPALYKLNKLTGEATLIAEISGADLAIASSLSADGKGNLWGLDRNGQLFTIDKLTAVVTIKHVIGSYSGLAIGPHLIDRDNDGMINTWERRYGLNQRDPGDASLDNDNDGLTNLQEYHAKTDPNNADTDGDNVNDGSDAFPLDPNESRDYDFDGIGDNADSDDDGDGVADIFDDFPLDDSETTDTDNDGIGNNKDTDDDNDGISDEDDALPLDNTESVDTDGDGIGNNRDTDDDNDGVVDSQDAFPLDGQESVDTDADGIGNNADTDDDNDGVVDAEDAFPLNKNESVDTDLDGIGNNADTDDDNDQLTDIQELEFGSNPLLYDTDLDGLNDFEEFELGTSPVLTDTDGDKLSDGFEITYGLDPLVKENYDTEEADYDEDGLSDYDEMLAGTHPGKADTDEDGLLDGDEVLIHLSDPNKVDTDGDTLSDFDEVTTHMTSPISGDSDDDLLPDAWEVHYQLDPLTDDSAQDADGDTLDNLTELNSHTHPKVADVVDVESNDNIETAQSVDESFNVAFNPNIGDRHDNTSETIPHATVFGQGSGEGDFDFYSFTVTKKDSKVILDVDFIEGSGRHFDSYMMLYDGNGRFLWANDDANWYEDGQGGSTSTVDSYMELTLQPGTYYVKISAYPDIEIDDSAAYQLHISVEGVEPVVWQQQ